MTGFAFGRCELSHKVVELDVVFCCGNQVVVYDVKIDKPTANGKTKQRPMAKSMAALFGGLSAMAEVVRPNWSGSTTIGDFAGAISVPLFHRCHIGRLRREALTTFGPGLEPRSLPVVDRELRDLAATTGPYPMCHRHHGDA